MSKTQNKESITREENIHRINDMLINLSRITPNDSVLKIIYRANDMFGAGQPKPTNEQILSVLTKYYKFLT